MSSCPFNDVFNSKDSHMEQINTFLKNVQVLLEAARFLESAERKDGRKQDFIVNSLRQQRAEFIQLSTTARYKHSLHRANRTELSSGSIGEDNRLNAFIGFRTICVCITCMLGTVHIALRLHNSHFRDL
ncbi:Max-interacting protein 1 [Liparis tanakae]|uniref:Max-interacting protein 1 n=1 Tax=Liparis tanakae TaxID=230148 RepID=A0A4Z2GXX9_9TELE|nr:Max-interacting protein 1 [Liparis tanakae]